jgi:hypothetical protein
VKSVRARASRQPFVYLLSTGAAVLALCAAAVAAQPSDLVDASLDSMRSGRVSLASERGRRVIVLFYEDRPHVETNSTLKGDVARFLIDNHLEDRLVAYGVANLGDVGMVPETLVRSMIDPLVERWGTEILLDWQGVMRRAPFNFQTDAANVGIVDRNGRVVWRHAGPIDDAARREFYRALRGALATPPR